MATIFKYLKTYKYINFNQEEFNQIDALILTAIVYLPLPKLPRNDLKDNLFYLLEKFIEHPTAYKKCVMPNFDLKFARMLKDSTRFNYVKLYKYYEDLDESRQTQFRALTFVSSDKKNVFVSYCGTDTTLVGWKEDLNLSYQKETSAQKSAVAYLKEIASDFPDAHILVGGHSKGGNLAMYAASFVDEKLQDRIERVFNYDGPGFLKEVITSNGYQRTKHKITTFVPYYSIVGMLFEHEEKFKIINSGGGLLLNHSYYFWKIDDKDFEYTNKISRISLRTNMFINDAISQLSESEIRHFCANIYLLFTASGMKTTREIGNNLIKSLKLASNKFDEMSQKQQDNIFSIARVLFFSFIKPLNEKERKFKLKLFKKTKNN